MSSTNGEPIHPILSTPSFEYQGTGLSTRTWLAGLALAGLAQNGWRIPQETAGMALAMADALLVKLAAAQAEEKS